ncbi:MAG TPA: DUF3618 domain-containing protein [Alphaproteobacteria bacterium]|nr:DUF3618 domain-containing protein [Alphaproteobacteria bacterium]
MANNGMNRSAELEREVEAQRSRVEQTLTEIQERLTPGQLMDEALRYTKDGGAQLASNLGRAVAENPLPAALLAVSLAWLMAGPRRPDGASHHGREPASEPTYRTLSGDIRRVSHTRDDRGQWYSEFADDMGRIYRAKSDAAGRRAGHFMDDAGNMITGFIDENGRRIGRFTDEAGNVLDDAMGWASHTWTDVTGMVGRAAGSLADAAKRMGGSATGTAGRFGGELQSNASRMSRDVVRTLEEQPLIAAALAFAAGAAIGAILPRTEQEDQLMGEISDEVKDQAAQTAAELYEQGKETASEVYEDVSGQAKQVYEDTKRKLVEPEAQADESRPITH